ncbi:MAG: hypothetical protein HYU66_06305 [Armatimonadetes bacterium]|nr:hypothetical protein [Armatimonadota bacterium]
MWLMAGCGGSVLGSMDVTPSEGVRAATGWVENLTLVAFQDQWASSRPRWKDIGDGVYADGFKLNDSASLGVITLRYAQQPGAPYFVGEIKGAGLKPNFFYQMKLMGKPGTGTQAAGRAKPSPSPNGLWRDGTADMSSNKALLQAGRWWNYRTEDPAFTTTNDTSVLRSADYKNGWVPGYIYFGGFFTDKNGNTGSDGDGVADFIPIASDHCYHITGKTGQGIGQDTTPVDYTVVRTSSWGYLVDELGPVVSLWYEKEPDDPLNVSLPRGTYNVVLMITEESFHASDPDGGNWRSVRVSDWPILSSPKTGQPWVSQRGTPITFTVN